jgi:hypothetical protein
MAQFLIIPERFWVVNPNPTKLLHHVLRGIALYKGWYYLCCSTTSGWCLRYLSEGYGGDYRYQRLAFRTLEHAVAFQDRGMNTFVDYDRGFLVSPHTEDLEALDIPFPHTRVEDPPHICLWYYPDGEQLTGWISFALVLPHPTAIRGQEQGRDGCTWLEDCHMATFRSRRRKYYKITALFGFSLRQSSIRFSLGGPGTRHPLPLGLLTCKQGQALFKCSKKYALPVEVRSWPGPERICIPYICLPGRIEGIIFVRQQGCSAFVLSLDDQKGGELSLARETEHQVQLAPFAMYEDIGEPEPAILTCASKRLSILPGPTWTYNEQQALCHLEKEGGLIRLHPTMLPSEEVDLQRMPI